MVAFIRRSEYPSLYWQGRKSLLLPGAIQCLYSSRQLASLSLSATNDQLWAHLKYPHTNVEVWITSLTSKELQFKMADIKMFDKLTAWVLFIARIAVGAVNMVFTLCSAITRQNVDASGAPTGLPSNKTVVQPANRGA